MLLAGNLTIAGLKLGRNIRTTAWAPQNDVLGHPSVKAFVMQGGINSLYEAAYHAKPVVTVPLGADQVENAAKVWYLSAYNLISFLVLLVSGFCIALCLCFMCCLATAAVYVDCLLETTSQVKSRMTVGGMHYIIRCEFPV